MEAFSKVTSTDIGDVLLHIVLYPNGSSFVWISSAGNPSFDDFHAAALTEYSDVPSVSTRVGETDSLGRTLSMKLARRFKLPTIVSWSLPSEFDDFSSAIEREVVTAILERKSRSPAVVGV